MRAGIRIALLVLAAVLAGCAAPIGGAPSTASDALLPSLQVYTEAGRATFVLQVTNTTESPVRLEFANGQAYDFLVFDDANREVWRWSADQFFTQAEHVESLAGGASLQYEGQWTPPSALRGSFVAVGRLTARNEPLEQAGRFELR